MSGLYAEAGQSVESVKGRLLAKARPTVFGQHLVQSLMDLASSLSALNRHAETQQAIAKAQEIVRRLGLVPSA